MKINKNTASAHTCNEQYEKQYCVVQELHVFHNHLQLNYKSFSLNVTPSRQYFHYLLQLIYQLTFSQTYKFHNLNIRQHHMIYHIHIPSC